MTEYYVDYANGSNTNNSGTSVSDPYKTLQAFDSFDGVTSLNAGDTVYLRDTATILEPAETTFVSEGGSAGNPVTITNYQNEQPVLDYSNGGGNGIRVVDTEYWNLENVKIQKTDQHGVNLNSNSNGAANYWTVENVEVTETGLGGNFGAGIKVVDSGGFGPKGITIQNCYVHDCRGSDGNSTGIDVTTNSENCLIRNCVSSYNGDDGYDVFDANPSNPHLFKNNVAHHNGYDRNNNYTNGDGNGFKLGGGAGSGGHTAVGCVSYGNYNTGFTTNDADTAIKIHHCTAYDNGHGSTNSSEAGFRLYGSGAHKVRNNIAYQNSGGATSQVGSNVVEERNTWNIGISDPQFRSTTAGSEDFLRLQSSSPCIDAGSLKTNRDDARGMVNWDGHPPDLGAHQYHDAVAATTPARAESYDDLEVDNRLVMYAPNGDKYNVRVNADGTVDTEGPL